MNTISRMVAGGCTIGNFAAVVNISESQIYAIKRPHPRLLWLYLIRATLTGPGLLVLMPLLVFRYITLRYRIDPEGLHASWGLLFRNQVNLTYTRIQDIHLTSGPLQRWFGLADLQIQTAAGSSKAEMTIEGMRESEAIRDFLYTRMRGYRASVTGPTGAHPPVLAAPPPATVMSEETKALELLGAAVAELHAARLALERLTERPKTGDQPHV